MAIYLDSAIFSEIEAASKFGWTKGVTTNPTLLAKSELSPETTLRKIALLTSGQVFYQLVATNFEDAITEGKRAYKMMGNLPVLKIPATTVGFQATARLHREVPCAVTAIYHPSQAAIAQAAGAKYAIVYVNRATRLLGDGPALVREVASVLAGSNTEILAASIKSSDEAVAALQAGAHHLTLPFAMLEAMTHHELSEKTVADFADSGTGIAYRDPDPDTVLGDRVPSMAHKSEESEERGQTAPP